MGGNGQQGGFGGQGYGPNQANYNPYQNQNQGFSPNQNQVNPYQNQGYQHQNQNKNFNSNQGKFN